MRVTHGLLNMISIKRAHSFLDVEGFILSATKFDESHPRKQYTVIGRNTSLFGGVTEGSFPGTWEVIRGPRWFTTSTWLVVDTIHQMNQTNFDLQTGKRIRNM